MRGAVLAMLMAALAAWPSAGLGQQGSTEFTPAQRASLDRSLAAIEAKCRVDGSQNGKRSMLVPAAYCACRSDELRREVTPQVFARSDRAELDAIKARIDARCIVRATRQVMPATCEGAMRAIGTPGEERTEQQVTRVCGCFSRALDALDDSGISAMIDATDAVDTSGIRPEDPEAAAIPAESMQGMLMACGLVEARRALRSGSR